MISVTGSFAQDIRSWEEYFSGMGQLEDAESEGWEQIYDELSELHANKIDLNKCTREDLEQLPFLSEQQIMDIMEYRDRAKRFETFVELRLIPSLEKRDVDMLEQFLVILPDEPTRRFPTWKNIMKYGKHELVGMLKVPFYERKGDKNGYLGYKYKHWLRYTFTSGRYVKAGFLASQDAGEPFFSGKNGMGYDFYSFYILLRDLGRLKTFVAGRYRLRYGMGLILNNSFSLGKLNCLSTLGRSANHIFAHGSRSEANYLQGGAATVCVAKGLDVSAFVSWRKIDATLNSDSATVATILKTGYHRTESEIARRCNTSQTLWGGNVNYFNNGFHAGITAFHTSFDRELQPGTARLYRRWYPAGSRFWSASIDYGYTSHRLNIAGETATGNHGAVATLNTVSYQLAGNFSLMALQRYYPYQYYSLYGESFAEGGSVSNESGMFVGANWSPRRGLDILFYTDYAYFPWSKYMVSQSSHSWDNFLQATYRHKRWMLLGRYRFRMKERDNADKSALIYRYEHRGRLAAAYETERWSTKTQVDVAYSSLTTGSFGYMLTENIAYRQRRWQLFATVGYFNTDDYASRVYVYERALLYTFSFPVFFGEGIRYALNACADIGRHVMLIAKLGTTNYFDRSTIGSALQQIDRSSMTELEIQLRLKL